MGKGISEVTYSMYASLNDGARIQLVEPEFVGEGLFSLNDAIEAAIEAIDSRTEIESIDIYCHHLSLLREYCGYVDRDYKQYRKFNRDCDFEEPTKFVVFSGDINYYNEGEFISEGEAVNRWCELIRVQGTIEQQWICIITRQRFNDDGDWYDDNEPDESYWSGYYFKRTF
jgi:hypothetical protein